jgi:hypothetical protein
MLTLKLTEKKEGPEGPSKNASLTRGSVSFTISAKVVKEIREVSRRLLYD